MMTFLGIYSDDITFLEALVPSLIAILIVFVILVIIMFSTSILKKFNKKESKDNKEPLLKAEEVYVPAPEKKLTIDDIKDEDMMVAALIATIDYAAETKKDVRLVSIKQIQ